MCHIRYVMNYAEAISGNIRAERARLRMSQISAAEGMRAYGFTNWSRSTLAKIELGQRHILAEEILTPRRRVRCPGRAAA